MKKRIVISAVFLLLIFSFCKPPAFGGPQDFEIPDGLVWLNSQSNLKVSALKGKFVVVYFWNYAGINIQSVVDQCRELQEKYPQELVLIGVHTGKALDNDDLNGKVAEALVSYRIGHPVAVDDQLATLKLFHTERWPSAVLFSPDGKVLFRKTGEQDLFYLFNKLIQKNLPNFEMSLDKRVLKFQDIPASATGPIDGAVTGPSADKQPETAVNIAPSERDSLNAAIDQAMDALPLKETAAPQQVTDGPMRDLLFEKELREIVVDPKKFTGEKIYIGREYSQKIGEVQLNFRLPDDARLLNEQQSYTRIYTEERDIIYEGVISGASTVIPLSRELMTRKLYVEAVLYYCTKRNKAICRIKSMLFVLPIAEFDRTENIILEQEIAGESL